jgi:hypothetical protein
MRRGTDPAFAAGCGQFMMVRAADYFACGGHSGIKRTMHDGLRLPRLFREKGFRTDLADLTDLASCRMYTSAAQVWSGLAKNATEGLAEPSRIVPISLVLILGQVVPSLVLALLALAGVAFLLMSGVSLSGGAFLGWILGGVFCAFLPRILGLFRFRQDWRGALLHPLAILVLLCVQWYALLRKVRGGAVSWRDRVYAGD